MQGDQLRESLKILGDLLASRNLEFEVLAVGGGALLLMGVISRPTIDLDIIAFRINKEFKLAEPFPDDLAKAVEDVSKLKGQLLPNWLNAGPKEAFRLGLPDDFESRLTKHTFNALTVFVIGRLELIGLKLHAWVDRYPGGEKHLSDLKKLSPTSDELRRAAEWIKTHDFSEAFAENVESSLVQFESEKNA